MLDSLIINFLEGISLAAVLVWLFSKPWQSIWIDYFKTQHHNLQIELAEAVKDGRVEFNNPAYKMLQQHLEFHIHSNDAIRFGSLAMTLIVFWRRRRGIVPLNEVIREMQDVNLQMELMQIYERSVEIQILQAAARSPLLPLLLALAIAATPIAFLGTWAQKARRFIVERAKIADTIHTSAGYNPSDFDSLD